MDWGYIGMLSAERAIQEAMQTPLIPEAISYLNRKIAAFEILDEAMYATAIAALRAQVAIWERVRLAFIMLEVA